MPCHVSFPGDGEDEEDDSESESEENEQEPEVETGEDGKPIYLMGANWAGFL